MNDQPEWLGWHFLPADGRLANGDRRRVVTGETLTVDGAVVLCRNGLHASKRAIDALTYAPGPIACRVQLSGEIVEEGDKAAGGERTVLAMVDATEVLRAFARWCALEVAHLWDMPPIVRQYLETGDESIRAAAWAAARAAGRDAAGAAWTAARSAAEAAVWTAAGATSVAAWTAAWTAAGATRASRDAGWTATLAGFNQKLEEMLLAAMEHTNA